MITVKFYSQQFTVNVTIIVFLNIKIFLSNNNVIHDYCKVVQSAVYSECEYN